MERKGRADTQRERGRCVLKGKEGMEGVQEREVWRRVKWDGRGGMCPEGNGGERKGAKGSECLWVGRRGKDDDEE